MTGIAHEQAEHALLGVLMQWNDAYDRIGTLLTRGDFARPAHGVIFETISNLIIANKPADTITVHERLQAAGFHEDRSECYGLPYLNALATSVPGASGAKRYAEIIRDRSVRRHVVAAANDLIEGMADTDKPAIDSVGGLHADLDRIMSSGTEGPMLMSDMLVPFIDELNDSAEQERNIPTGFDELDEIINGGLYPGDLIVLGARPSMGKTAFAMNIAEQLAVDRGMGVLVFSLEMMRNQLLARLFARRGRIPLGHVLRPKLLTDSEWGKLSSVVDETRDAPLFIDDKPGNTIANMRISARRIKRKYGLRAIVADHLGLITGSQARRRQEQIGEYTRGLKEIGKELGVPVIALAQLNRDLTVRADKRPQMADLRESGDIEQDADMVMFLHREEVYSDEPRWEGHAELLIRKQRNGPLGDVPFSWKGVFSDFRSGIERIDREAGGRLAEKATRQPLHF